MVVYSDLKTQSEEDQFLSLLAGLLVRSFISLLGIERKIEFLITGSYPMGCSSVLTTWQQASPKTGESREKAKRKS